MDMVPFAQAVIAAAPDRVIWGTDWPHGNTFMPGRTPNEGDLLDILALIAPDPAVMPVSLSTTRPGCLVSLPLSHSHYRAPSEARSPGCAWVTSTLGDC